MLFMQFSQQVDIYFELRSWFKRQWPSCGTEMTAGSIRTKCVWGSTKYVMPHVAETVSDSKNLALRAGFEPARGDPIGFQVQRLNHSAITACEKWYFYLSYISRPQNVPNLYSHYKVASYPIKQRVEKKKEISALMIYVSKNRSHDSIWILKNDHTPSIYYPAVEKWSVFNFLCEFTRKSHRTFLTWQKFNAANRIRTCAGRPHWISSPTP